MALTACSCCRKANYLTIFENQCFKARTSTAEILLLRDSIIKGQNRHKGTWYKYFPNFLISAPAEIAQKMPDVSYLTNVIILCGTNDICIDFPYDIAQCLIDIGVCFQNWSPKIKIFISGILPRDKCYSVNRILIKEINAILKYKCAFHRFNFIEQEQGWTDSKRHA